VPRVGGEKKKSKVRIDMKTGKSQGLAAACGEDGRGSIPDPSPCKLTGEREARSIGDSGAGDTWNRSYVRLPKPGAQKDGADGYSGRQSEGCKKEEDRRGDKTEGRSKNLGKSTCVWMSTRK